MMMAVAVAASAFTCDALSGMEAQGHVKPKEGAFVRSAPSTVSSKVGGVDCNSPVEIMAEIFTKKNKTGAKYRWYYVNTGAGVGYMRSDTVTIDKYGSAKGYAKKKIKYYKGAGKKMKKKGTIKKKKTFTIVMEAKAKGSSKRWYKIKKGSKYYYVCSSNTTISDLASGLTKDSLSNEPAVTVTQSAASLQVVNGACAWAAAIAADNTFHYGYGSAAHHNGCYFCNTQMLTGGRSKAGVVNYQYTYCCNPFVHAAFAHGGNEGTMLQICQSGSSYDYHQGKGYDKSPLFAKLGKPAKNLLKKGDVICWDNHVALYMGGGKIAEAAGGDDNVPNSEKWNNSIRVCDLSDSRYAKAWGAFRYIGQGM